jgi:hypothetical protein
LTLIWSASPTFCLDHGQQLAGKYYSHCFTLVGVLVRLRDYLMGYRPGADITMSNWPWGAAVTGAAGV